MSEEKINLNDLMNEKFAEEASKEKETTATAEEPTRANAQVFDPNNMVSVDLSQLVPSGKEDATKKAQEELMEDLDDGIKAVAERRFGPALKEIRDMREEYEMRKAAGEEDPKVKSKFDPTLDLDPNLTDEEVAQIRKDREDQDNIVDLAEAAPAEKKTESVADIEEEFNKSLEEAESESDGKKVNTFMEGVPTAESVTENVKAATVQSTVHDSSDDEEDLELDLVNELDELTEDLGLTDDLEEAERIKEERRTQKNMEEFAKVLRSQLSETSARKPDISKFKVRKRPKAFTKVLATSSETQYFTWGLFATGISVAISPLSAIELDKINPYTRDRNDIVSTKTTFDTIYKHLAPACRDMKMEEWMKLLDFQDLNHLFFALYNANFHDSNIIPFTCPKCNHFYSEKRDIIDMVKFETDGDKENFNKVIKLDPSLPPTFEEELYVANDKYAFGIVIPKLYNSMFEERLLDEDFRNNYAGIINLSHCISTVYEINEDDEELIPIQFTTKSTDIVKTYKYRILSIYKVLSKLSGYEFKELQDFIAEYIEKTNKNINITYQVPAAKCPKCGAEIPAIPMSAQDLVFTRHQLIRMLD